MAMHKLELLFNDKNGKVMIAGPLTNKVLCLGILQLAIGAITDSKFSASMQPTPEQAKEGNGIEVVPAGALPQ